MSKYLAIDGWREFQPLRGRGEWIKDSTIQQDKEKFLGLGFFERGLLQELRRVRGRIGKNIPYDLTYILSATHAKVTDRPHVSHALSTLLSRGILVLTDQQVDAAKVPEREIEKENKKEKKIKPISSEASSEQQVQAIMYLPLNNGEEFGISTEDFALWKSLYPAVDVMQELRSMVGWCHANVRKRKTRDGVKRFINSWLAKAQNNPKAAENYRNGGQTSGISKADAREQRIIERAARFASSTTQSIGAVNSQSSSTLALPGNGGSGVCGLAGEPELLPPERSPTSPRPTHAAAAKAGAT